MFEPSALVNNVLDSEMEKVKAFYLCILSFSEVLHTLGIIINDTRTYTVPLYKGAHIDTKALILAQYLIVTLKGHELRPLQETRKDGRTLQFTNTALKSTQEPTAQSYQEFW